MDLLIVDCANCTHGVVVVAVVVIVVVTVVVASSICFFFLAVCTMADSAQSLIVPVAWSKKDANGKST